MAEIKIDEYNHKEVVFPYIVKKLHAGIIAHYDIHIIFTEDTRFNEGDTLHIGNESYFVKNLAGERPAKGDFSKSLPEGYEQPKWIKARCKFMPQAGNIYQQQKAQE